MIFINYDHSNKNDNNNNNNNNNNKITNKFFLIKQEPSFS
jgi:hypothetical protein